MSADIWGRAIQQVGSDIKFGANLAGAWNSYLSAKMQANQLKMNARLHDVRAGEYEQDIGSSMREAGEIQLAGRQHAALRTNQLAQDIGRISAGAAGSGIDVSSATVRHVIEGERAEAGRDLAAINANAANAANAAVQSAANAEKNAAWARADAAMARLNAKYTKKAGKIAMIGGIFSAVGQHMGETAQNWS